MNRDQVLTYLGQLPRFSDQPGIYREEKLLSYLGNPEKEFPVIHITGTNGKGSVSAMLAEVLKEAGLRVGVFTSPHLEDYPERIQICGEEISWKNFGLMINKVAESAKKWQAEEEGIPTEFDVLTAAGFLYFASEKVDVAIVEVGMGGTFDSTNVVTPILTIITNVAADHLDKCGPTLMDLARHKAGIIKKDVPVVSAVEEGPLREIIRLTAEGLGAPSFFAGESWQWTGKANYELKKEEVDFFSIEERFSSLQGHYYLSLLGKYQQSNAALTLAALAILEERWPHIHKAVTLGLDNARWPGRFEIFFRDNAIVVVDGAHNSAGAKSLRESLEEWFPKKNINFIVGFLGDKNGQEFMETLHSKGDQWIGVSPNSSRKKMPEEAQALLSPYSGKWAGTLEEALSLVTEGKSLSLWVVCGSLYLVGPARRWICENFIKERVIENDQTAK